MEITHRTHNLRIAPRKLRLVVDKMRYQKAEQALEVLNLIPNKGGLLVSKSLKSAIQVAKDNNLDSSTLIIQRAWCDEGTKLKRLVGASRGRMLRIMKHYTHLSLVLTGEEMTRTRRKVKTTATEEPSSPEIQPNNEKE